MLIDWFTVGAQTFNFLILVYLMKRFLYQPILQAIQERDEKIAKNLHEAAQKKSLADRAEQDFKQKNSDLEQQSANLLDKAVKSAHEERDRLLQAAKEQAEKLYRKRMQFAEQELTQFKQQLVQTVQSEVFAISRKSLADLADVPLEQSICDVLLKKIALADAAFVAQLSGILQNEAEAIIVRSCFTLPQQQQVAITQALYALLPPDAGVDADAAIPRQLSERIQFLQEAQLLSGIEIICGGQKIAWSIENYLQQFEQTLEDKLVQMRKVDTPDTSTTPATTATTATENTAAAADTADVAEQSEQ